MYQIHSSENLVSLFEAKPYQGADPMKARFLFVGLDANYSPAIEKSGIFPALLEYHDDGVAFWQKHHVHHPFLLPEYSGDGQFYHKSFARIGFTHHHATDVSFVELLQLPTIGRSKLSPEDLESRHLAWLRDAMINGDARYVFLPTQVGNLMRQTGLFPWFRSRPRATGNGLGIWYESKDRTVNWHYHFSVYGKFEAKKKARLQAIGDLR